MNNKRLKYYLLGLLLVGLAWTGLERTLSSESALPGSLYSTNNLKKSASPFAKRTPANSIDDSDNELNQFKGNFQRVYGRLAPQIRAEYTTMVLNNENDFTTDIVLETIKTEPPEPELLEVLIKEFNRTPSGPLQKKLFLELNKYTANPSTRPVVLNALTKRVSSGPIGANEWFLKHIFSDLTKDHYPAMKQALDRMSATNPNRHLLESIVDEMDRLESGS